MKKCKSCLEEKELCEFYKNSLYEDNLDYRCKTCFNEKRRSKDNVILVGTCKICSACKEEKDLTFFSKKSSSKSGYESKCKLCVKNKVQIPTLEIAEGYKKCTICLDIKLLDDFVKSSKNKSGLTSWCKLCKKHKGADYNQREDILVKKRISTKLWSENNHKKMRDGVNRWRNNKRNSDILYRLKGNLRGLIMSKLSLKGDTRLKNFDSTLLCTIEEFKNHIEKQFLNWMSWENYGNVCEVLEYSCSWDLDHIIPLSYAKTEEEVYMLNHWSNFQPLCSKVNRLDKKDNIYPCTNLELNTTVN